MKTIYAPCTCRNRRSDLYGIVCFSAEHLKVERPNQAINNSRSVFDTTAAIVHLSIPLKLTDVSRVMTAMRASVPLHDGLEMYKWNQLIRK